MIYSPAPLQTPPPAGLPDGLFEHGVSATANSASNGEGATPKQSPTASMHRTLSDISNGHVPMPGSTVINLPTPAPSPQPESGRVFGSSSSQHLAIWDGRGSPVSPDVSGPAGGADFGERFIDSVVAHYPRLSLPERRKLFTALLPFLQGEDLLHLSQLISPYLRRDFLAELPAEISLHILSFIDDPKDLVRASRVSRTWRSLVSDDHTWKLMLHKYKGRGWAESRVKAPIERIRMKHPEARFGAITSPPAVPRYSHGMHSSGLPLLNQQQQSSYFSQHEFQSGSPVRPPTLRRISTLSPTAQPFMYPRPSLSVQTGSSAPGPTTQRSQGMLIAEEDSIEEEDVNRFLDENQTPLAERRRRLKGKSKGKSNEEGAPHRGSNQQASTSSSRLPPSASAPDQAPPAWQMQGLGFAARRLSYQPLVSPSAPPPRSIGSSLLPPPPQDLHSHFSDLSLGSTSTNDSGLSPAARFATVDYSPAAPKSSRSTYIPQYNSTYLTNEASSPRRPPPLNIPSPSPVPSKGKAAASSYTLPAVPRPRRYIARRSMNPFGVAITTQVATKQYDDHEAQSPPPFSYKTQFKKAYLTESNWLKGPGRVLCTQTSSDDGVVTSLGFDNDWVVVGMATNQVHVFDAKTGEYARNLHGHTAGVWCLILVSKGGERVDKDGRRVREAYEESETSEASEREDEEEMPFSHRPQRCRSASARPPDVERFFGSEAGKDSPNIGEDTHSTDPAVPDRSTRASTTPLRSPGRSQAKPARINRHRRPSSFCGLPSASSESSRQSSSSTGFPFADAGNTQQASACGTAAGWGQKGAIAVTAGCDRDIRVWDVESGRCNHILRGHMSTVRCLKVLDGRPIMVSGSRDATLRVWDIEQGTMLRVLAGHQHSVRCIEISGNKVVSGSYDTTCRIWDVDTGECLHLLEGHQHQIYAVAFDGVRVASGSLDSTVRIWSAKTGECLALLQGHTSLVGQLQLTDSVLVTGGSDGRVIIFSLSTFECLHRLCAHDNSVTCLQFNDRFMVTGGNDGRVKLWDRPSGKLIRELAEPCEAVWRVTFREDKCVLLCKRNGRTVMDVRTFAPHDDEL